MKMVLVEWEDASVVDDGAWITREGAAEPAPKVFHQVGWLVSLTGSAVVLTQAADAETMAARDRIPRGMVRSIKEFDPVNGGKPMRLPPIAKPRPKKKKD